MQRINLNLITNGSAFEMNVAWQLQLGTLLRASIMYAASLRNSFTHLTQGPLCCCHEIKLYAGIVSFLYPIHTVRLHSLPPPCVCMYTHTHTLTLTHTHINKLLYCHSASVFLVEWTYQYNYHKHNEWALITFFLL